MTDRTNEDVALLKAAISTNSNLTNQERDELDAIADALQARLEVAEANYEASQRALGMAAAEREEARAALNDRLSDLDVCIDERYAYRRQRDEARADAERLAEALRGVRDWVREGFGTEADAAEMCDAALAAHTPHPKEGKNEN